MTLKMGCIADDLTGASDLAGELVARGMRTLLVLKGPITALPADIGAVVIGMKTRTLPVAQAVEASLKALQWLQDAGAEHIYFKYCSTFDSTPQGNIGPVLDALSERIGSDFSIACPAFPANNRTVYNGHLFVGEELLSESGMRFHPLTPMLDSNLVRLLSPQTSRTVGLLPLKSVHGDLDRAIAEKRADGVSTAIADAITDEDLRLLGRACAKLPLSSGASGLAAGIAYEMMGRDAPSAPATLPPVPGRRAILAGSCSQATRRQVARMILRCPSYRIALSGVTPPSDILAAAISWIERQNEREPILLYTTAAPDEVDAQRRIDPAASEKLEELLAQLAQHLVDYGTRAMICAGGETSGRIVGHLGVKQLHIGPEIDPGVPWTIVSRPDAPDLLLALKSGNFGTDDFLSKAWDLLP